jgi:hypothetical protein
VFVLDIRQTCGVLYEAARLIMMFTACHSWLPENTLKNSLGIDDGLMVCSECRTTDFC